ncbi:uncharacterized protein J7T54_004610 [Emericellopsis cladophorae]|uniref:RPA43 OB domain-containing protein n=1 Tax=Emericellopsis cladophorae TaxID=2686198 RepID=A0A9P9Y6Y6_9HYPO|nr:uncharacterized protein J7T54_004610 [Emericellopsis cladophorae]KAI6784064.1 hypothetical protein J7T54_004610 [Emericellopsis cladophorae]
MAPIDTPEAVKPKKEKKDKSAKKRAREEEAATEERKHKKSKSVAATSPEPEQAADPTEHQVKDQKKQKKKKKDKTAVVEDAPIAETPVVEDEAAQRKREKKEKRRKQKLEEANGSSNAAPPATENDAHQPEDGVQIEKKDKKKKKDKKHAAPMVEQPQQQQQQQQEAADPDAMQVDSDSKPASKPNKIHQPSDIPSHPQFPFYQQTVSLYEPIFPNGWAKPITGCESQHLRHLRNRYVPSLRGVLLDYENITLGEVPGRRGAARDDESPTLLTSKAEFGGAFGWMTADVKLFVPSRGAWMEGSVNLQTEGHIGVVCFGKFNASIEARRLPPSWKWVSDDDDNNGVSDETASVVTGAVPDEHGVVRQIHSTGYWVDEAGDKVAGKTRFRIRNFDVGISGDSTYLSLQGTMLDRDSEKKLVAAEAKDAKERRARRGGKQLKRTVPDFSMTKFDYVEEEGQDQQQAHDVQQALELPEGADGGDLATETE